MARAGKKGVGQKSMPLPLRVCLSVLSGSGEGGRGVAAAAAAGCRCCVLYVSVCLMIDHVRDVVCCVCARALARARCCTGNLA